MTDTQINELDLILKRWARTYDPEAPIVIEPEGCKHDIKLYIGFREEYEFCAKCDAKKLDGQWTEVAKH
ncbi:MAG: hypothetical protein RJB66_1747 [Pseudomonadota bacterium]